MEREQRGAHSQISDAVGQLAWYGLDLAVPSQAAQVVSGPATPQPSPPGMGGASDTPV
jgi:hypothetical protein